ncbi:PACE efflux transporter [Ramlibacter sp. AN1015]|uniref:PACE efflux transporter n=1 Tax=Ramlibacter sp. AN1015 TaxID=3133428 RepID=UPI0030C455C9
MRTVRDRIRHAVSFELIGLALITPLGAWGFGLSLHDMGIVGVVSATLATLWNYVYNVAFDHALLRASGTTLKGPWTRVLHAVAFELGLLVVLMPFLAWYLQISLWDAFVMDAAIALFYMLYAWVFNWGYDRVFPLAEWQEQAQAGHHST